LPSIRIPAQAAAVIVLVALIAWAVSPYSQKHAEEARRESGQKDKAVAGSSQPRSPEPITNDKSSQEAREPGSPFVDLN